MITIKHYQLLFLFLLGSMSIQAQITGNLHELLQQTTDDQRTEFFSLLDSIDAAGLHDSLGNSGVLDSLRDVVNGDNPIGDLDSLTEAWSEGRADILEFLDGSDVDLLDQDTILGEFDRINSIWNDNVDGLSTIFDDYQDSLNVVDITVTNPPSFDHILLDDIMNAVDTTDANGLGGFGSVFGELFDASLFDHMELAYGRAAVTVGFYGLNAELGMDELQAFRLGSVPSFNSDWEAQWHVAGTWTNTSDWQSFETETNSSGSQETGFHPLTLGLSISTMFNPKIGWFPTSPMTTIRLITSIGVDVSTYVPSHSDFNQKTNQNVGFTTSFGPEVGTGFAVNVGPLSTYAMGKMAYGLIGNSPGYNYRSVKFEAGTRYGNAINIRYTIGQQDWAPNGNKSVTTAQQVTIGILVDALFN